MNENSFAKAMQEWSGIFARRTIHDFMAFAHEYDISMPQINVLMRLYYRGPASILALRQELYGSRSAATQLIDKLVQMGLIERSESQEDRRVKAVRLTDKGHQVVEQGIAARRKWLTDLAEAFDPSDQAQIAEILNRLSRAAIEMETREEQEGKET
jgi:DNA-binding MarR family transcriptional regulator